MAAPWTAPERFVMVRADSDAAPFDRALSVPKKYGRAERARSFRISRGYRAQITPRATERPYPIQTVSWCRHIRGSRVQGTRASELTGFSGPGGTEIQGFTGDFTVQNGGGDREIRVGDRGPAT